MSLHNENDKPFRIFATRAKQKIVILQYYVNANVLSKCEKLHEEIKL